MSAAIKRRKPGGGRKPQGQFKGNFAVLNLRVTPSVRAALERAAKKNDTSLSQEAQRRLDSSFEEDRRLRKRRPDLRALTTAITMVADHIECATGKSWQDDAFTSEALRHGIDSSPATLAEPGRSWCRSPWPRLPPRCRRTPEGATLPLQASVTAKQDWSSG